MGTLQFEEPILKLEAKIRELRQLEAEVKIATFQNEIAQLEKKRDEILISLYARLSPWEKVQVARFPERPGCMDYINHCFRDVTFLSGDRAFGDDPALLAGFGYLNEERVFFLGNQKGKNMQENIYRNFGMAKPEGYRKATRVFRLAEKFSFPLITIVDTPGAYPGIDAEERGQSFAIAQSIFTMCAIEIPTIAVIIGEGGSGGALALASADRVLMFENSVYSVISSEGCASILWKDASKAGEAAERLKLTAGDLLSFGVIDEVISEPNIGAHRRPESMFKEFGRYVERHLKNLKKKSIRRLLHERNERWERMGREFLLEE